MKAKISRALPLFAAAAGLGVYGCAVQTAGGSAFGAVWCWLCGMILCLTPGLAAAELLHPKAEGPVRRLCVLTWGPAAFAPACVLASASGLHGLVWLPAVLGGAALAVRAKKAGPKKPALPAAWPAAFWAFAVMLCGLGAVQFAHPAAVGAVTPSQDFFWNLGNVQAFLRGFPPQDMRFSGVTLRYHYLTELAYAGLSMGSGLGAYDVTAFYGAPLVLAGTCAALWNMGAVLFEKRYQRWLCLAAPVVFGCAGLHKILQQGHSPFWNSGIQHVLTNINAQATATMLLAVLAGLFAEMSENGVCPGRAEFWAALAAFGLLCFGKGPVAGIAGLAVGCTAAVLLLRKEWRAPGVVLFAVLTVGGFFALYRFFFSAGASTSMALDPAGTLEKSWFVNYIRLFSAKFPALRWAILPAFALAQTVCFCPAAAGGWLAGLGRDVKTLLKGTISPNRLFWSAGALGGFAAFYLFDHYAMSQMYFGFVGLFFMELLAIDNLPRLKKPGRAMVAALAAVSAAGGVCCWLLVAKPGLAALPDGGAAMRAGALETDDAKLALTAEEEEAMLLLAKEMRPGEKFATNRIHTGSNLEGLSNVYSGLSGQSAYMESFKYAVSNMGVPEDEVTARVAWVEELFGGDTTPERAARLCAEAGVQYVVWREGAPGSEAPLAEMEALYRGERVRVYRVPGADAAA